MYTYKAKIIQVYDGDTVTAVIELGFNVQLTAKLRLARINAPELRGPGRQKGVQAKLFLTDLILNKQVTIITNRDKKGRFGRYIASIYLSYNEQDQMNVNEFMVDSGHAVFKHYR